MLHTSSGGLRMTIATQPAVVAGGMTIWTRSPVGNEADSNGDDELIRCSVELATSFASLMHHSKSACGKLSRRHPVRVSRKASRGRLMQSSMVPGHDSSGRSACSVNASAVEPDALTVGSAGV